MPKGVHNPLPASLKRECKKAAKILESFINPRFVSSPGKEIPKDVLAKAQGLVILTVLQGGFIFCGRFGSGIIVARLNDGTWSAPSAIGTAGGGAGGLIGLELTNFVFVLRDKKSVETFSQFGSLTLELNLSVALGPIGRNAEISVGASRKGFGGMIAYSSSKGLYGGISLEGGVLIEGRIANSTMYQRDRVTAWELLSGEIIPPPETERLMNVLNSEAFRPENANGNPIENVDRSVNERASEHVDQNTGQNINQNANEHSNQAANQNANEHANEHANQNANQNTSQNTNLDTNEHINQNTGQNTNQNTNEHPNQTANQNPNRNNYEIAELE